MSVKFSVLVAVYNVEEYITECIESILSQTYTNYELLLVDDGSTDKSGDICRSYEKKDSRIKYYYKENRGPIHTRIYAMERAVGGYYVFVDSDDKLKADALEIIEKTISKNDCDCVIYGFERIRDGKILSKVYDKEEIVLFNKTEICKNCFFDIEKNSLVRKAVKSDAFNQIIFNSIDYSPYYYIRHGEDLLLSLEIYKYCKSIAFISDVLYEYRDNLSSISHEKRIGRIDFTVRKKALDFLVNESGFSESDFNHYRDFCIRLLNEAFIRIAISPISKGEKKELLTQIRADEYYQDFLQAGITDRKYVGKKAILFDLFKAKKEVTLLWISFVINKIVHVKC